MRLAAGDAAATVDGAGVRGVTVGGHPLLRRVALVVRDAAWGTVRLAIDAADADAGGSGVVARGTAERGDVHLAWELRCRLEAGGRLLAHAELRARDASTVNRAGLVVLLDPAVARGAEARFDGPDGPGSATLPDLVGPQVERDGRPSPLVGPFARLHLGLRAGGAVDLAATGDLFELEDERNWTDGSFKVYSTPLRLGVPHELAAGATVRQELALGLRAPPTPAGLRRRTARPAPGPVVGGLPAIGTHLDAAAAPADPDAVARLGLAHVRVDAGPDGPPPALRERLRAARAPLELALHLDEAAVPDPDALAWPLAQLGPVRVLVHGSARCTPPELVAAVTAAVERAGLDAPVAGGTDRQFADLNRDRPPAAAWDGVVLPMSPQVHGRDDLTVVGALAGMPAVLDTARLVLGARAVHVSPLTMTPRTGPGSVPADATPGEARGRMARPLTAAWTLAAVGGLAAAGGLVRSVTAFADAGPNGLFADADGARLPVAEVLAALAPLSGRPVRALDGLPAGVHGFGAARTDGGLDAWLGSVAGADARVALAGDVRGLAGAHEHREDGVVLAPGAVVVVALPAR